MDGDRLRLPANRNCYRLSHVSWALLKFLVFSVIIIPHQVKNHTNHRWIFNFCKIPWNYQNSAAKEKFHGLARNSMVCRKLYVERL